MSDIERIAAGLRGLARDAGDAAGRVDGLAPVVAVMRRTLQQGGTLFFAGNGGSAADAQHIATEYVVRFHATQRRALRAIALTTDTSLLTAAANDLGFAEVFARQVEALARAGDTLVLHSTSGNSNNLVRAAQRARTMGVTVVALLGGDGGELAGCVDHAFVVTGNGTARVQELQLAIQHQIADILTAEFGR
ncbi:MAG: SIS domain-containing protein [Gemmatimonadales bacterium]|nr:SIS domain-containing protein [Gemmatimonadales bacterium]